MGFGTANPLRVAGAAPLVLRLDVDIDLLRRPAMVFFASWKLLFADALRVRVGGAALVVSSKLVPSRARLVLGASWITIMQTCRMLSLSLST